MSLYSKRDIRHQGQYYLDHVSAMTEEDLHDKSDIAAELAYRDIWIANLSRELSEVKAMIQDKTIEWLQDRNDLLEQRDDLIDQVKRMKRVCMAASKFDPKKWITGHDHAELVAAIREMDSADTDAGQFSDNEQLDIIHGKVEAPNFGDFIEKTDPGFGQFGDSDE